MNFVEIRISLELNERERERFINCVIGGKEELNQQRLYFSKK